MIQNRVEQHVTEAYESLRVHFTGFCGCEVCKADIVVYALNRLPARYVVRPRGTVITELTLDKDQNRAAIEVAVMDGFKIVMRAPRCGFKP